MDAVTAAFSRFLDYAGLFPPAGLAPAVVIGNYARYKDGPRAWLLGRLVLPADLLDEAARLASAHGAHVETPWPVTALVGGVDEIDASRGRVARHRTGSVLRVEAIEAVAHTPADVASLSTSWPDDLERFVEIPADPDPARLVASLAQARCDAKIRAGGMTPQAFPSPAEVARFLMRARDAGLRVKATAGLHHALRGRYSLTDEPESATAIMHGFVNLVFAAALLAARKIDDDTAAALLDDDRREVFTFGGRAAKWLNAVVTYAEFAHARTTLLRSVGSCSFDEPGSEIRELTNGE